MINSFITTKIKNKIFFLFLYFFNQVSSSSICDNKSPFYGLYLNTSFTQEYSNTNLSIISDCSVDKYWRVKTGKEANFHVHKVLEDESINRRILKFGYNISKISKSKIPEKYKISLKSSILEGSGIIAFGPQKYSEAKKNKSYEFIFEPNNDINYVTYITYYCNENILDFFEILIAFEVEKQNKNSKLN